MKSELHKRLQVKGENYLLHKGYWVRAREMPTNGGIIDVWGISNIRDYETAAIEVKVSRNDYRSRSQKYKEHSAEYIANYCYILCPEYLMGLEHESPNWGVLWYSEKTDRLKLMRKPIRFEMTDRAKLGAIINFFYSGINKPNKLLNVSLKNNY